MISLSSIAVFSGMGPEALRPAGAVEGDPAVGAATSLLDYAGCLARGSLLPPVFE